MLFTSLRFAAFLPVVFVVYYLMPPRHRWTLLLAAGACFYAWARPSHLLVLAAVTAIAYGGGLLVREEKPTRARRRNLALAVAATLGLLIAFKYAGFACHSAGALVGMLGVSGDWPVLEIALPLGISFYAFRAVSYLVDVYRGDQPAELHLGRFALYVSFFPQLLAGPIERASRFLPQARAELRFDYTRVTDGLILMAWGFFKKLVVADRLAVFVNAVYGKPDACNGVSLIAATVYFAIQIYCDFSGYSDIAVGIGRLFGYDLMQNFDRPYHACSLSEFWQRWHISLSTWFRDYLYIPLGGNRTSSTRWVFNIAVVFVVSGLWHGANWTFVAWGVLHGTLLVVERFTARVRQCLCQALHLERSPLRGALAFATTFAVVCLAWVPFRAESLADAAYIFRNLHTGLGTWLGACVQLRLSEILQPLYCGQPLHHVVIAFLGMAVLETVHQFQRKGATLHSLRTKPALLRWSAYGALGLILILFGVLGKGTQFVYFQF